nr:uncharacterized protein LOC105869441 isoform X2 [Microcebus murinus]
MKQGDYEKSGISEENKEIKNNNWPGAVVHTCGPSSLGGQVRSQVLPVSSPHVSVHSRDCAFLFTATSPGPGTEPGTQTGHEEVRFQKVLSPTQCLQPTAEHTELRRSHHSALTRIGSWPVWFYVTLTCALSPVHCVEANPRHISCTTISNEERQLNFWEPANFSNNGCSLPRPQHGTPGDNPDCRVIPSAPHSAPAPALPAPGEADPPSQGSRAPFRGRPGMPELQGWKKTSISFGQFTR